ncbi:3-methyladenine DNA glycosylase AlkD OS=Streptomyces microflavus OX=1919 GN=Smic_06520 PE=4 SV=1 [Streptomyces microflavus]
MDPAAAPAPAVPDSPLADAVLARLTDLYAPAADPVRAGGAAAYMKHVAPFLGIPTPRRRALSKAVLAGTGRPDEQDCTAIALRCWRLPEREYAYFAVDYLRRTSSSCSSGFLPVLHHLVTTVPWWDTVDLLAAHVAGPLVAADPALAREMDLVDRRRRPVGRAHRPAAPAALQGGHRRRPALRLLPAPRGPPPDFFIRKAIGWALREYAKTDPTAVRDFVDGARDRLSPLSVREALKNL